MAYYEYPAGPVYLQDAPVPLEEIELSYLEEGRNLADLELDLKFEKEETEYFEKLIRSETL